MKVFLVLTILCVFGDAAFHSNTSEARESLNPLTVDAIRVSPETYDGKILKVSGQVRSMTPARGRIDSEFIILVLEGSLAISQDSHNIIQVFTYSAPPLKKEDRVIVSGTYHETAFWAGFQHDHFIVASEIKPLFLY